MYLSSKPPNPKPRFTHATEEHPPLHPGIPLRGDVAEAGGGERTRHNHSQMYMQIPRGQEGSFPGFRDDENIDCLCVRSSYV